MTHKIVDELRAEGIEDRHMHTLAKRDTPLEDLPEASEFQKTDFIPALERGAALGGTTGVLAGLQVGNSRVKEYEDAIERGELLVMVDIPKERIEAMSQLITKHHPTAQFEGIEPLSPPPY